jgi:hypothetical protein
VGPPDGSARALADRRGDLARPAHRAHVDRDRVLRVRDHDRPVHEAHPRQPHVADLVERHLLPAVGGQPQHAPGGERQHSADALADALRQLDGLLALLERARQRRQRAADALGLLELLLGGAADRLAGLRVGGRDQELGRDVRQHGVEHLVAIRPRSRRDGDRAVVAPDQRDRALGVALDGRARVPLDGHHGARVGAMGDPALADHDLGRAAGVAARERVRAALDRPRLPGAERPQAGCGGGRAVRAEQQRGAHRVRERLPHPLAGQRLQPSSW